MSRWWNMARPRSGDIRELVGDNTRLRQVLGVAPSTALHDGLAQTLRWMNRS